MTMQNTQRKMLHRKKPETCTAFGVTNAGSFVSGDVDGVMPTRDHCYFVNGVSGIYRYALDQDAWLQLPNSGITGVYGAGSCGQFKALGMLGGSFTSTGLAGGTTTKLNTNRAIVQSLKGCELRVIAGAGVGYVGTVVDNTLVTNAVITVTPASAVAFDATTVFQIYSGSLWFFNAGTAGAGFRVYDVATNAWTGKSVTGLPTVWGTCGQLVSTGAKESGSYETGTSSGTNTATTLNNSAKSWGINCWANSAVRITAGTGNGQVRPIASNTATALTIATAWTITPDTTSVYSIEGNCDQLFLLGNNTVAAYKYTLSTDTWATLAPTAARAGSMGGGATADFVVGVTDIAWKGWTNTPLNQSGSTFKQNGRYIYSFRGAGAVFLDIYDIAANTWISQAGSYGGSAETFNNASCSSISGDYIYISKENTGRTFRFDLNNFKLEPWTTFVYGAGGPAVEGDKLFAATFKEGSTLLKYLYVWGHTSAILQRMIDVGV